MPLKSGSQALPFDPVLVGERFEAQRLELDMSRALLAAKCGYSAEQIRRVERGEQAPGARLLAALAEAGGDIRGLLLGAGHEEDIPEADAIFAAQQRHDWAIEARLFGKAKSDRRKRLVSDDEADLLDAYRELYNRSPARAAEIVRAFQEGGFVTEGAAVKNHISADRGSYAAGGDMNIGSGSGRQRK